jgi:hypothetical protein
MPLNSTSMQSMRRVLCKYAAGEAVVEDALGQQVEAPQPAKPPHPALTAAKRLGAYGLGTGAGMLGGMLAHKGADALHQKFKGGPIPVRGLNHMVPLLGGAAGLAFQIAQNDAFKTIREDSAARRSHVREAT